MTEFDRRTPVRTRTARVQEPRVPETRALDADDFALSALSAPFPPAAAGERAVEREDDADADPLGQDPTTVRPRSSAPSSASAPARPSLVGLPAITAPPGTQALADVDLRVAAASSHVIQVPEPASGSFPFAWPLPGLASDAPAQPAARDTSQRAWRRPHALAWGARRVVWLGLAAALFAGLGALVDRSGALDALWFPGDSPAEGSARRPVATVTAIAAEAPTVEPLPGPDSTAPAEDVDSLIERSKRLLGAGDTVHLRELSLALIRARTADPANPHVRGCLGEVLLRRGNYTGAFAEAVEAVHLRPRRARYRVLLGDVYRAQGDAAAADAAYQKAHELDPKGRAPDDAFSVVNAELRAPQLL